MAGGAGIELVATGSDDGTVRLWEGDGDKQSIAVWDVGCPVTAVCWSADGQHVYVGALDNEIHVGVFFWLFLKNSACVFTHEAVTLTSYGTGV